MNETSTTYPFKLWFAATCAWLGSLQFGFHLVRVTRIHCRQRFSVASSAKRSSSHAQGVLNTCLSYTSTDLGITEAKGGAVVTSVLLISAAVGGFFAGQVADAIGPRRALVWNTVPFFAGSLMSAIAPDGSTGFWAMLLGAHTSDDRLPGVALLQAVTGQLG